MERELIKVVTVTGADDSIRPEQLIPIAGRFPFVEFGILLSKKQRGTKRFPSWDWLENLYTLTRQNGLNLSGHICGSWVRDLCMGKPTFFEDFGRLWSMFRRFQLNFHAEPHAVSVWEFGELLKDKFPDRQIIFQIDGVNEEIFESIKALFNIDICPLFDSSGGCGELPKEWPKKLNTYCGYAGGLSPDNLQKEMEKISKVADSPIWIDAETLLRSENDKVFSLDKVHHFLEAARPWVSL